jgi:hypothetical protein
MIENLGKIVLLLGIFLVVAGIILIITGNKLDWPGHLPGDIRIERENLRIYFPITTMILLSLVVSAVIFLIKRYFHG